MLTGDQARALVQWKNLLAETGLDQVLIHDPGSEPPRTAERLPILARLFGEGEDASRRDIESCVPDGLLSTLEALGLVNRIGDKVAPKYRLVFHQGLWLFCEKVSRSAKFYYGNDSIDLSRILAGAEGSVLDLCSRRRDAGPGMRTDRGAGNRGRDRTARRRAVLGQRRHEWTVGQGGTDHRRSSRAGRGTEVRRDFLQSSLHAGAAGCADIRGSRTAEAMG